MQAVRIDEGFVLVFRQFDVFAACGFDFSAGVYGFAFRKPALLGD